MAYCIAFELVLYSRGFIKKHILIIYLALPERFGVFSDTATPDSSPTRASVPASADDLSGVLWGRLLSHAQRCASAPALLNVGALGGALWPHASLLHALELLSAHRLGPDRVGWTVQQASTHEGLDAEAFGVARAREREMWRAVP